MKKITLSLLLLISAFGIAQVPSYYNDVNLSLTGSALKDELATKITSTHVKFLSYSEVWDASKITDLDPADANQSKVILIYGYNDNDGNYITDRTRSKDANGGTAGTDWNREHSYPKSLGTPNLGTTGPGSDAHHLRPADVTFNGNRGSKKFAAGSGNAGDSNGGWYPGDEWKGDIARMMMYMYLRYGNQCLPTGVGIGSSASTSDAMIDLFLQWNAEDPVSQLEINRNEYHGVTGNSFAQGNRNPFIDNPAFATQIWGGPQAEDRFGNTTPGDTQAPTAPTGLVATNTTETGTTLTWDASTDNIAVVGYNIYKNGSLAYTTTVTTLNITGLMADTSYTFTVRAKDAAGNVSNNSNTVSITTQGGSINADELFFSEYVEGSSNNKALEIANFTGQTIDLSMYSLKRNTNGGNTWGTALSLSGQLVNGQAFVVANSAAAASVTNSANLITSAEAMTFNGNDPVGLFKNNILIDIIGDFNGGSANFAQNTTLRRKETITAPNTNYTVSEWESFASDTFDGLGSHSVIGNNQDTQAPTAPTGLIASNTTQTTTDLSWVASTDNVGVVSYTIFQNGTVIGTTSTTNYSVTDLSAATNYNFSVTAQDEATNTSVHSNTIQVTTQSPVTTEVLLDNSFETGWEGWSDGGSDCYRINSSRSYDGNYSIRIRDNSGTASSMTSGIFNVSPYNDLEVTFFFYSYSMESGEDFWLQYYDGSTWRTVESYISGIDFNNNSFYTATVSILKSSYNFPTNAQFRFRCDASSNADQIYIDKVSVIANSGSAKNIKKNTLNRLLYLDTNTSFDVEIDNLSLYPNPTNGYTTLKTEIDLEGAAADIQIQIINTQGKPIKTLKLNTVTNEYLENELDLSGLSKGIYFIHIISSKGFSKTKKVIIK